MRFLAVLLLIALAGTLISAQTSPAQDLVSEPEASVQATSAAAQPAKPDSPLKSVIDKGLSAAGQAFEGAEKKVNEKLKDGKNFIDNGIDFIDKLRKKFDPRNFGF